MCLAHITTILRANNETGLCSNPVQYGCKLSLHIFSSWNSGSGKARYKKKKKIMHYLRYVSVTAGPTQHRTVTQSIHSSHYHPCTLFCNANIPQASPLLSYLAWRLHIDELLQQCTHQVQMSLSRSRSQDRLTSVPVQNCGSPTSTHLS